MSYVKLGVKLVMKHNVDRSTPPLKSYCCTQELFLHSKSYYSTQKVIAALKNYWCTKECIMEVEAYSLVNLVLDAFTNKRLYKESILFIQKHLQSSTNTKLLSKSILSAPWATLVFARTLATAITKMRICIYA